MNTFSGAVAILGGGGPVAVNNAGATDTLSGGYFVVENVGNNAALSLGANDTVVFAPGVNVAAALGAATLAGGSSTVSAAGTYLVTGTEPGSSLSLGGSSEVFFGSPNAVDAFGFVTQSSAVGLSNNAVSISGASGTSQTLFGAGNAFGYGVAREFSGGTNSTSGNLLVGAATILGGGSNDTLVGGAFTQLIQTSFANSTLIGGTANSIGYVANESLSGVGNDTFIFGTGNETITGGTVSGGNTYIDLNQTAKNVTIALTDFQTASDKLELAFLGSNGAAASVTGSQAQGSDYLVSLSDGVTVRFVGLASQASAVQSAITVVGGLK